MKKPRMTSNSTEPHSFLSLQIEMLTDLRATKETFGEIMSINILLVSASTAFLERVMAGLLLKICNKALFPGIQEPIYWKIYEQKLNSIKNGTFSFYEKEIVELTGKSFDKFATQDSWAAIKMLFKLRNHLLHGQEINVGEYHDKDKNEYYFEVDNLKPLQSYLTQKKLLSKNLQTMGPEDIVNNKVVSHFLHHSYEFAIIAHANIIKEYDQQPLFLMDRTLSELERVLANMKN